MNYDRIILELMDRVAKLEEEVEELKKNAVPSDTSRDDRTLHYAKGLSGGRDTTKYMVDGVRYGKGRMVLAVVKKYVEEHPDVNSTTLGNVFDASLQGSLGVVRTLSDVENSYSDYERRFYCGDNEVIDIEPEKCVVCSQWGKFNIDAFVKRAEQLGIEVTEV